MMNRKSLISSFENHVIKRRNSNSPVVTPRRSEVSSSSRKQIPLKFTLNPLGNRSDSTDLSQRKKPLIPQTVQKKSLAVFQL